MTFEVQPSEFTQALNRVVAAVERNKENPVVGHVLITTVDGTCTLRATDYFVEITTSVSCQGEMPPIVVPADRLQNVMSRMTDRGIARFEKGTGDSVVISSGRIRQVLPLLEPADNFPTIARDEVGTTFVIEGKVLTDLFDTCTFAVPAKDSRRPILEGLYLFEGDLGHLLGMGLNQQSGKLCAVATDGYKLMAREVAADLPPDMPKIVVPRRAIDKLGRMVKEWAEVQVEITAERFIATFGPTRFIAKLLDGKYPDWWVAIPKVAPSISYDADHLASAIGNAFAAVRADKKYNALKVAFAAEDTSFDIQNGDGSAAGSDACHHSLLAETPPNFAVGFNPTYFLEVIEHMGAETIQLGLTDGNSPTLITCPNLQDRMAVLMPVRLGVINASE